MGSYVEPRDGQAERWLKIAAAGRPAADQSPLVYFLAAREASAAVSMAASLVDLVELLRPDVTLAQTGTPGERQYDPARAATLEELRTAPLGTMAVAGEVTTIRIQEIDGGSHPWLRVAGPGVGMSDPHSLMAHEGARITHLPVPVAQTPAGPVAAVVSPVPLASADTLPDEAIDEAMQAAYRTVHAAVTPKATSTNRKTARALVDAVNARLRAQFPDETPVEPADETPQADLWRAYDSRDLLAKAALTLAAESFGGVDAPARASAASDVDTAARTHVAALGGPVRSPGFLPKPGMISTDNYDPATLAPGSVIVGPGSRVSLCVHENGHDGPSNRWMVAFPSDAGPQWSWRFDGDITDNGVLVVDGATLGGQR